ncbi:RNA ligase family protein [Aquibacillus saliphilus]|uniref:RNA ligase family protein n=1 Tax=Aquibacillus saliphilus TaxID=1909422 RepID=UPI001CF02745|nr:RNA ligase family protein [Aquibacillus saliphilus]
MKKYDKIVRHGQKGTHLTIENNPEIVIMEKLDGANASFKKEDGKIKCFSRNNEVNEDNNLRGFYEWVQENVNADDLVEGGIYFGEWLIKHTINYPQEAYQNFYLFDIYDEETERYINYHLVEKQADKLGLKLVPLFYQGEFQSLDHINSFVGKSKIGEVGEGVVVKNYNYEDKHGDQIFTKIVSEQFSEKAKSKKQQLPQHSNELDDFVNTYLTQARVEKMLHKLVDEGIIEEEPSLEDMGTILKNSGNRMIDDILEEEMDSLVKIVKKKIGKKYPSVVKEILSS